MGSLVATKDVEALLATGWRMQAGGRLVSDAGVLGLLLHALAEGRKICQRLGHRLNGGGGSRGRRCFSRT